MKVNLGNMGHGFCAGQAHLGFSSVVNDFSKMEISRRYA
jgi:hypothetical protein